LGDRIGVMGSGQVLLIWFVIVRRGVDPVLMGCMKMHELA
jgi:hypothetical protein